MSRATLHAAHCDIWELTPESPGEDEAALDSLAPELAPYIVQIRPVYAVLGRVMGQFSGLFLLSMTASKTRLALDHQMFTVACDQLAGCEERLAAAIVPAGAVRHHNDLRRMAGHLSAAAQGMTRLATRRGGSDADTRAVMRELHAAQHLFVATAEPGAKITPVDFSHACCSCGATANR